MSVRVDFIGRFGNSITQYSLGRILAEKMGLALDTFNCNRDLRETFSIDIPYGSKLFHNQHYFHNCPAGLPGKFLKNHVQVPEDHFDSLDDIVALAGEDRGLLLHGFYQRAHYYIDHREKIREWFKLPDWPCEHEHDLIMHFRHGDYLESGQQLETDYYDAVVDACGSDVRRICIIGDTTDDKMVGSLIKRYNAEFSDMGSDINDFRYMQSFGTVACANSSFSWWGAWLGRAEKIFIPQPGEGKYWSANSNQQLFIPNSNMIRIPCR